MTQDDIREWVSTYGITHPVVNDGDWAITYRFTVGATSIGLPAGHLLAPGAEVLQRNESAYDIDEDVLIDVLEQYLD